MWHFSGVRCTMLLLHVEIILSTNHTTAMHVLCCRLCFLAFEINGFSNTVETYFRASYSTCYALHRIVIWKSSSFCVPKHRDKLSSPTVIHIRSSGGNLKGSFPPPLTENKQDLLSKPQYLLTLKYANYSLSTFRPIPRKTQYYTNRWYVSYCLLRTTTRIWSLA